MVRVIYAIIVVAYESYCIKTVGRYANKVSRRNYAGLSLRHFNWCGERIICVVRFNIVSSRVGKGGYMEFDFSVLHVDKFAIVVMG